MAELESIKVDRPLAPSEGETDSAQAKSLQLTPSTGEDQSKTEEPQDGSITEAQTGGDVNPKEPPFTKGDVTRVEPVKVGKKLIWKADAKLYCPKNGYPHALAQEFGIRRCPACFQDLFKRHVAEEPELVENADGDIVLKGEIVHEVQIRDSGGYWLGSETWPTKFDLQEARRGLPNAGHQAFLKVVTELRTTHRSDKNRSAYESRYILEDGIFDNPSVGIRTHSTLLEITSAPFIQLLRRLVPYYPGTTLEGKILHIQEPYLVVAYHIKEIENFKATYNGSKAITEDEEAISLSEQTLPDRCNKVTHYHIETILSFIKENIWKDAIDLEMARHNQREPMCTYAMLWLLYEPGTTVYIESDGRLAAYIVQHVHTDPATLSLPPEQLKPYNVITWYLDFDGRYIRRFSRIITIMPFSGEKPIASLSIIPSKFQDAKDQGETKARLHQEGKRWFELLRGGLVRYTGDNLEAPRQFVDGRVVVDCSSYHETKRREKRRRQKKSKSRSRKKDDSDDDSDSDDDDEEVDAEPELVDDLGVGTQKCPCDECMGLRPHPPQNFRWKEYDLINPLKEKTLELLEGQNDPLHRYLLCSKRLMGFVLKTRSWEILDVKNCGDPGINKGAIDMLVMPKERKKMIKALVHRFRTNSGNDEEKAWSADFIENKGEGKIFLLHGSPGVGKTYTAECIAEFTGRPLLSLTCGDLGNNETVVEKQLSKWFKLAEKWGAVMLLDEADVYTEKRMVADLNRNSMVSVFLRCMEYYRGILFLTTNRVGSFDDAFISRIHVVIHYKDLTHDDRTKIWNQFFDKLESDKRGIRVRKSARTYVLEDADMRGVGWNGREIRNAFQTAVALCEYEHKTQGEPGEAPALERDHFEQVCEMALQFKKYLHEVHGADEAERAAKVRARAKEVGASEF
ncbi:hypothetical protein JX266_009036 [Neoarthrinium moseri]|nr:hypothetical protein JX266_009036 [Neoarthrinium moseri]